MKYAIFLLLPACTPYYPMRRTYGSCDAMMDRINYRGGPFFLLLLLLILLIVVRLLFMNRKK